MLFDTPKGKLKTFLIKCKQHFCFICDFFDNTDCNDPAAPSNGTVNLTKIGVTTYQATATLYCNEGYSLSGNDTMVCNADGKWSQNADCIIKGVFIMLPLFMYLHNMAYGKVLQEGTLQLAWTVWNRLG